jgi:hypothetical protein
MRCGIAVGQGKEEMTDNLQRVLLHSRTSAPGRAQLSSRKIPSDRLPLN